MGFSPQRYSVAVGRNQKAVDVHEHVHVYDHVLGLRTRPGTTAPQFCTVCDESSEVVIVDVDMHVLVNVDGSEKLCQKTRSGQHAC
jgi:hypothetical protein